MRFFQIGKEEPKGLGGATAGSVAMFSNQAVPFFPRLRLRTL